MGILQWKMFRMSQSAYSHNKSHLKGHYMEIMCEYDEAFTVQEMLEETGQCKDCKLNCLNAGKSE